MSIGKKPGIIREPGGVKNLPVDTVLLDIPRLRNSLDYASLNIFNVYSLLIDVREVFAIGRDRSAGHGVFRGINRELPKFDVRSSLGRRWLAFRKPQERSDNQ